MEYGVCLALAQRYKNILYDILGFLQKAATGRWGGAAVSVQWPFSHPSNIHDPALETRARRQITWLGKKRRSAYLFLTSASGKRLQKQQAEGFVSISVSFELAGHP